MKKEDMLPLREGLRVQVTKAAMVSPLGPVYGRVRGIAMNPAAVIGRMVIIEPDEPIGDFSHVCVAECHLREAPEISG